MTHHRLSERDYEGYGVYEYDGIQGFGQLPDLGSLQQYEVIRGLAHVPASAKPYAKQLLEQMVFTKTNLPELGGVTGTAGYVFGTPGSPWVSNLVASGYVVMVERSSVPTGTLRIVASSVPATIVLFAGQANPAYVIVDGDPGALGAAEAYAGHGGPSGPPPALPPEPPPSTPGIPPQGALHPAPCDPHESEVGGWCYKIPGGVEPPPGAPPPEPGPVPPPPSKLGSWVLPVAIGAVGLGLVAVVVARRSAPSPKASVTVRSATPNRRRRNRRRTG